MMAVYADESESAEADGVFTMFGLMVDADDLIRIADEFDDMLLTCREKQENGRSMELKTGAFMGGKRGGGGQKFNEEKRKEILEELCGKAISKSMGLFGIVLSLEKVKLQKEQTEIASERSIAWHRGGMFMCSIIQKSMQETGKGDEHAFVIFDGNNKVWKLSENMQEEGEWCDRINMQEKAGKWYDSIYQEKNHDNGRKIWTPRSKPDRFDRIVNRTAFSVNSKQSSLIQVSDAICYVYRRHFELMRENETEVFKDEQDFYDGLFGILEKKRHRLGDTQDADCIRYFNAAKHDSFEL